MSSRTHFTSIPALVAGTLAISALSSQALVVVLSDTQPAGSDLENFLNDKFSNIDEIRHGNYANFGSAATTAALSGADLVIIGRSLSSGDYDNFDSSGYNGISIPVVSLTSYTARQNANRLGWHAGGTTNTTATAGIESTITAAGASVFGSAGPLDLAESVDNSFNGLGTGGVGGGEILATVGGGELLAVSWAAGSAPGNPEVASGPGLDPNFVFGGPRLLYNLDNDNGGDLANFGADGEAGLISALGTVGLRAVPEPSAAMLGLLGLAGLAFRRRR